MIWSAALFVPAFLFASGAIAQSDRAVSEMKEQWHYSCRVEKQNAHGTLVLIRNFAENGTLESGDVALWNAAGYDPSKPKRPINWDWSYYWAGQGDFDVKSREIDLKIRIALDKPLPNIALLRIHRPFPVLPGGMIHSAGLITEVFGYGEHDPGGGRGSFPLGDLLAYAEGFDQLDWTLTNFSPVTGFGTPIKVGTLDVRGFREGLAELPELKRQLNTRSENVRQNCERQIQTPRMLHYHDLINPAPTTLPIR